MHPTSLSYLPTTPPYPASPSRLPTLPPTPPPHPATPIPPHQDYGYTWAWHLKRLKLENYLVGAMDSEALVKLKAKQIPTFDMNSGLTTADYGWGTKNFRQAIPSPSDPIRSDPIPSDPIPSAFLPSHLIPSPSLLVPSPPHPIPSPSRASLPRGVRTTRLVRALLSP